MTITPIFSHTRDGLDLLNHQKQLYAQMDQAYDSAAAHYRFACSGCDENCCQTRFYHHTIIEYSYLYWGMQQMEPVQQADIRARAAACAHRDTQDDSSHFIQKPWCPLNDQGMCQLYAFRPMICRLHGLPHELTPPGKRRANGPGCNAFIRQCGHRSYFPLDRTPLYRRLAEIEMAVRQYLAFRSKIRLTIAQMICHFPEDHDDTP
jgi:Fe-S-cluster containining protein